MAAGRAASPPPTSSHPSRPAEGLAQGQASERAQRVVGAYAVEVAFLAGVPRPLRFRERLRAAGPSVGAIPRPALPLAS
jgi:sulfite reductase (NADPH) hemoprotein beta-component